ncbi:MAG: hypothetical protein IBV52_06870 [Candidatus Bathyarchaeota archaeon]
MGLEFKPKLSAILTVIHAMSATLACIVTQGDITAAMLWFAISTGLTARLNYFKDQEKPKNQPAQSLKNTEDDFFIIRT